MTAFDILHDLVKKHLNINHQIMNNSLVRIKKRYNDGHMSATDAEKQIIKEYKNL
tara:strand:- start:9331 stop:9495 length:165 start_codon:yes stop_codon:yes gene_type:complete